MILEFDLGNTRFKWRLRRESDIVDRGYLQAVNTFDELESVLVVYREQIKRVWVASVVGNPTEQSLKQWSENYLSITPEFARSTKTCMGMVNGYDEPQQLGVDRWLSMVACRQQINKAFLLVSFGTAITADIVLENGKHVGGFIAPGLNLMLDSLQQKTRQVVLEQHSEPFGLRPGTSTTAAVYAAITAMLGGLLENSVRQLQIIAPNSDFDIVFAGGDAQRALPFYPQAQLKPELVLDGLAYALDDPR